MIDLLLSQVIAYPKGDWFGKLTPCHVEAFVERYLIQGEVIDQLWRGRIQPLTGQEHEHSKKDLTW